MHTLRTTSISLVLFLCAVAPSGAQCSELSISSSVTAVNTSCDLDKEDIAFVPLTQRVSQQEDSGDKYVEPKDATASSAACDVPLAAYVFVISYLGNRHDETTFRETKAGVASPHTLLLRSLLSPNAP